MLTVFRNGSAFDGRSYLPGRGVVVSGDRVLAVLADDDLPDGDAEVDLAGGMVGPGFVDAHVHAVQGGLERIRCDLTGWHGRDEYLAAIASYAGSRRDVGWVLGWLTVQLTSSGSFSLSSGCALTYAARVSVPNAFHSSRARSVSMMLTEPTPSIVS